MLAVTQETRDEGGHDSVGNPENATMDDGAAFLEVTHQELSELKQTLIAGRTASKDSANATTNDTLTDIFHKEMDVFQAQLQAMSPAAGSVSHNKNVFATTPTSREPSEISGSLGDTSIEPGSVKRLTNFFLPGEQQQKPTMDINSAQSTDRPKLSSPLSKMRRAALECDAMLD